MERSHGEMLAVMSTDIIPRCPAPTPPTTNSNSNSEGMPGRVGMGGKGLRHEERSRLPPFSTNALLLHNVRLKRYIGREGQPYPELELLYHKTFNFAVGDGNIMPLGKVRF